MASGGKEIKLLKHVSPVKPWDDLCTMPVLRGRARWGWGPLCQCNLKNNKSSEVSMNVHTAQDLTEYSDTNFMSKTGDKCVCQREGTGLKRWGVMKLWPPQNERRLGGISVVPCNNRPLSHWQSLIIQYEEDSSLSPPLSLSSSFFLRFLCSAI